MNTLPSPVSNDRRPTDALSNRQPLAKAIISYYCDGYRVPTILDSATFITVKIILSFVEMNVKVQELPERGRIDTVFRLVVGVYVAALVSPALLLLVGKRFQINSPLLTLGALGVILAVITAFVVKRRGELITLLNSTWAGLLLSTIAVAPMIVYSEQFFRYVVTSVTSLQAESSEALFGFVGFFMAMMASVLAVVLVLMARYRLLDTVIDGSDVAITWSAGWPRPHIQKLRIGAAMAIVLIFGLVWSWQPDLSALLILYGGALLMGVLANVGSLYTYRVTPSGLQRDRKQWLLTHSQHFSWDTFDSFSVSDESIILHRQFPHIDIRCSRSDIIEDENSIVQTLERYLNRKK